LLHPGDFATMAGCLQLFLSHLALAWPSWSHPQSIADWWN
jgi:hypothetical protein